MTCRKGKLQEQKFGQWLHGAGVDWRNTCEGTSVLGCLPNCLRTAHSKPAVSPNVNYLSIKATLKMAVQYHLLKLKHIHLWAQQKFFWTWYLPICTWGYLLSLYYKRWKPHYPQNGILHYATVTMDTFYEWSKSTVFCACMVFRFWVKKKRR